jgi:hypothetical protein
VICRRCGRGIMGHESIGGACANRTACDRRKGNNVKKRIEAYKAIAARCGTKLEAASPGYPLVIGGCRSETLLAIDVANSMIAELNTAGAEAKLLGDGDDGRAYVYLAGCSFDRGDRL